MMANILGACRSGAKLITDPARAHGMGRDDIGHFFLALDPAMFRAREDFRADVAALCDAMRAPPVNPACPVMVAGDPERRNAARRRPDGPTSSHDPSSAKCDSPAGRPTHP